MEISKTESGLWIAATLTLAGALATHRSELSFTDVATWLMVLLTAVITRATVGAWSVAQKWLPQLTTQEGYKDAIRLINDHYLWLRENNNALCAGAKLAATAFRQFQVQRWTPAQGVASYQEALSHFNATIEESLRHQTHIDMLHAQLATYGLDVAAGYAERVQAIRAALRESLEKARALFTELDVDLRQRKRACDHYSRSNDLDAEYILLQMRQEKAQQRVAELLCQVAVAWKKMTRTQAEIFSPRPTVAQLFEIRT
ncbi:hypothetical protein AE372_004164 [Salmonella enterica subsp. enterica serovar Colindale]|nr:hypothetical protein [Salmonella enterica subsp. enterica serovar Colindale]